MYSHMFYTNIYVCIRIEIFHIFHKYVHTYLYVYICVYRFVHMYTKYAYAYIWGGGRIHM